MSKVLDLLEKEDLKDRPDLYEMVDLIGLENVKKIIENYGGFNIYIPQIKNIAQANKRYFLNNYEKPITSIAKETGYSKQKIKELQETIKKKAM